MRRTITAIGAALCAGACLGAETPRPFEIAAYAPPHTVMLVDVPSAERLVEALGRTGLLAPLAGGRRWWEMRVGPEEGSATFEQLLERLDADPEDLGLPTGAAGLVLYFAERPDPEIDEEDADDPGMFLYADFGARAGAIADLLDAAIDEAERGELIKLGDDDEVDGVKIVSFESLEYVRREERRSEAFAERSRRIREHFEREDRGEFPEDLWSMDFDLSKPTGDPLIDLLAGVVGRTPSGAYAIKDGVLYLAQEPETIAQSLLLRRGGGPSALQSDSLNEAISIATEWREGHITMAVDMSLVGEALEASRERQQRLYRERGWDIDPVSTITDSLFGLNTLRGYGVSVVFGEADQIAEVRGALSMDALPGLARLFPRRAPSWSPPAYVPADAQTAARILVDFSGVVPLIREQINLLPAEQRAEIEPPFAAGSLIAQQVFDSLGSELTIVTTPSRAGEEDDEIGFFLAVACTDEAVITNLLSSFGGMLGMTPTAFEGSQLYHSEFGPAIGVGFDHVFIGTRTGVEDSLRRAAMPRGVPGLADEDAYRRATSRVAGEGTIVAYFSPTEDEFDEESAFRSLFYPMEIPEEWSPRIRESFKLIGPSAIEVRIGDDRVEHVSVLLRKD